MITLPPSQAASSKRIKLRTVKQLNPWWGPAWWRSGCVAGYALVLSKFKVDMVRQVFTFLEGCFYL
jgi:hypothetical protein